MKFILKRSAVAGLAVFLILISAGCTDIDDGQLVVDSKPAVSEIKKGEPTPLDQVIEKNADALQLATNTVETLTDEYLLYVGQKKQDDVDARAPAPLLAVLITTILVPDVFIDPIDPIEPNDPEQPKEPEEPKEPDAKEPNLYSSAADGYSIEFPEGWQIIEDDSGDKNQVRGEDEAETDSDGYLENIAVEVEELLFEFDLGEYADKIISEREADLVDFNEIERTEVTLDGVQAKQVLYTHKSGSRTIKALMYIFPKELKGYVITCSAEKSKYSAYEKTFETSAETFRMN